MLKLYQVPEGDKISQQKRYEDKASLEKEALLFLHAIPTHYLLAKRGRGILLNLPAEGFFSELFIKRLIIDHKTNWEQLYPCNAHQL